MSDGHSMEFTLPPAGKNPLADEIRRAVGGDVKDTISLITPQFARPRGEPAPMPAPTTREAFERLPSLTKLELVALGMRPWGREERPDGTEFGPVLWLFPIDWYSSIPEGLPVVDINFAAKTFKGGVSDDDSRMGLLPFGVLRAINYEAGETK